MSGQPLFGNIDDVGSSFLGSDYRSESDRDRFNYLQQEILELRSEVSQLQAFRDRVMGIQQPVQPKPTMRPTPDWRTMPKKYRTPVPDFPQSLKDKQ